MRAEFSEGWCYEVLRTARWPSGIMCPRCGQARVTTHSRSAGTSWRRYLCLACRRTFTDLTGTPFARTNLPLTTWFRCLRIMGQGRSTSGLAKELQVKWDTSIQLQRRLAAALARPGLVQQLREAAREARGA